MNADWDITEMLGSGPYPDTIISPIDHAEMVFVPAGNFIKGITEEELAHLFLLDKSENPIFATEVSARK